MPRPQFALRTLLTAMLVVAAFFGGLLVGRDAGKKEEHRRLASEWAAATEAIQAADAEREATARRRLDVDSLLRDLKQQQAGTGK